MRETVEFSGRPIHVSFRGQLSVCSGKLYSKSERGKAVHAASFLNRRRIVLDSELLADPAELRRILIHELFHFVWRRLGNPLRREWELRMQAEFSGGVRGDLGWSAECCKQSLQGNDAKNRTRAWRHYLAESFCDTAAWLFRSAEHGEHTLTARRRRMRKAWFARLLECAPLPL